MSDEAKVTFWIVSAIAIVIIVCSVLNVMTAHDCKIKAIQAGMVSADVREACK